jgi:hypothetical protein
MSQLLFDKMAGNFAAARNMQQTRRPLRAEIAFGPPLSRQGIHCYYTILCGFEKAPFFENQKNLVLLPESLATGQKFIYNRKDEMEQSVCIASKALYPVQSGPVACPLIPCGHPGMGAAHSLM